MRDGQRVALIDGDALPEIDSPDARLAARLAELARAALAPWSEGDPPPRDFSDGYVDLLRVACDYAGVRPTPDDVSGPLLGGPVGVRF